MLFRPRSEWFCVDIKCFFIFHLPKSRSGRCPNQLKYTPNTSQNWQLLGKVRLKHWVGKLVYLKPRNIDYNTKLHILTAVVQIFDSNCLKRNPNLNELLWKMFSDVFLQAPSPKLVTICCLWFQTSSLIRRLRQDVQIWDRSWLNFILNKNGERWFWIST